MLGLIILSLHALSKLISFFKYTYLCSPTITSRIGVETDPFHKSPVI